jgi:hypothetical protein
MISAGTLLCGIPASCFSGKAAANDIAIGLLRSYVPALRVIERRIRKGVAADEERTRYARLCRQIEEVALSRAVPAARDQEFQAALSRGDFPSIRIASGYLELLARLHAAGTSTGITHDVRLGATLFAPDELQKHISQFRTVTSKPEWEQDSAIRDRIWFVTRRLIPNGCGLIEFPDALGIGMDNEHAGSHEVMDVRTFWDRVKAWIQRFRGTQTSGTPARSAVRGSAWAPTVSSDWKQYEATGRGDFMHNRLRTQIEQALEGGPPIDLGNQRHKLLTEELVRQLHKSSRPAATAAMMYESGQPTRPFKLRCVDRLPDGWAPTRVLHVGLISMRHLPIDQYIDINWYRNVDVPSQEGLSGADEACYRVSIVQLARLADVYAGHRLRLFVYHAGFLPAVVAFYRALVDRLTNRQHKPGSLQVIPMLQPRSDGTYEMGQPWPG